MARITSRTFQREDILVDGNDYQSCVFIECNIIYRGVVNGSFEACTFTRCHWVFDGPAENTLLYLSELYHGLGDAGKNLVEEIFEGVREKHFLKTAAASR